MVLLLGAAATVFVAYLSVQVGAQVSVGALLIATLFVAAVIGFMTHPHIAVALTVVLFALIPTLKVFISPAIGPVKDLVVLAAFTAAVILYLFERRRPDGWILALSLLLLGLYLISPGGAHNLAWAQGVRLVGEPLLLLLVGLTLPQPRRTLRYAMGALVFTACLVAAYGLLQQVVGGDRLVDWGYSYDSQVRNAYGRLRSFGTLDQPFDYAAVLSLGIAAVLLWMRRGPLAWAAAALVLLGLAASLVRNAILGVVGLTALVLWRRGYPATAVLLAIATVIGGGIGLANTSGTQAHVYRVSGPGGADGLQGSANVILNGRVSAWTTALGPDPADWVLGRGVGTVGTATVRSRYEIVPTESSVTQSQSVDSGYLATVADVGFVGLAVLLALFGRLIALAADAARKRRDAGWVALGLLAVMMITAVTGSSFTGFPTAFVGLLLVGIALAAAREEDEQSTGSLVAAKDV
jgi:O-antigen ligase